MLASQGALDQVLVDLAQDVDERTHGHSADAVEDLLVALLGLNALGRIAVARAEAEELLEGVLEVELLAPAVLEGEGHGDGVTIVDLGKGVGIQRVGDMAAQNTGEGVAGEHGALAGAAAGHDIVGSAGVEQHGGKDAVLNVGERLGVGVSIHTVVKDGVAHGLDNLLEGSLDHGVLGVLGVLVDESDLHCEIPFLFLTCGEIVPICPDRWPIQELFHRNY